MSTSPAGMRDLLARPLHFAAAVVLIMAAAEIGQFHFLLAFEHRLSDFFFRLHAAGLAPDPDIVIVDIDEQSLARMQGTAGKWPWPRAIHAELLTGIEAQKPRAVVFDILFAEEDTFRPDSDRAFNLALQGRDNVYLPMVRLLVASGADIHILNEDNDTPLMLAAGVSLHNPNEDAGTEREVYG